LNEDILNAPEKDVREDHLPSPCKSVVSIRGPVASFKGSPLLDKSNHELFPFCLQLTGEVAREKTATILSLSYMPKLTAEFRVSEGDISTGACYFLCQLLRRMIRGGATFGLGHPLTHWATKGVR
jgi:hypothetical protein